MDLITDILTDISSLVVIAEGLMLLRGEASRRWRRSRTAHRHAGWRAPALMDVSCATLAAILALAVLICLLLYSVACCLDDIVTCLPGILDQVRATEGSRGIIIAYTMIALTILAAAGIAIIPSVGVVQYMTQYGENASETNGRPPGTPV